MMRVRSIRMGTPAEDPEELGHPVTFSDCPESRATGRNRITSCLPDQPSRMVGSATQKPFPVIACLRQELANGPERLRRDRDHKKIRNRPLFIAALVVPANHP